VDLANLKTFSTMLDNFQMSIPAGVKDVEVNP